MECVKRNTYFTFLFSINEVRQNPCSKMYKLHGNWGWEIVESKRCTLYIQVLYMVYLHVCIYTYTYKIFPYPWEAPHFANFVRCITKYLMGLFNLLPTNVFQLSTLNGTVVIFLKKCYFFEDGVCTFWPHLSFGSWDTRLLYLGKQLIFRCPLVPG